MATPTNRSPWQVKLPGKEPVKFRLKSQGLAHLAELGYTDPAKFPKGALKQLETAFEVQIKFKDKHGNVVKRSETHDTYDQAQKWATQQEALLVKIRQQQGGFEVSFETITFKEALEKFHKEHYAGKASFKEIGYRVPHIVEKIGANKLFRELNKRDYQKLRDHLLNEKYAGSSVRNYFTILTSLYKHAANEWNYPVENPAAGIKLPKPNNAIQRSWVGNEQERLMASLEKRSPWLIPIVELSLAMAFRRGELVPTGKDKRPALSRVA